MTRDHRKAAQRREVGGRRRAPDQPYAFVSYSSKDWDFVRELVVSLADDGVWVDKRNIDVGDPIPAMVESGITGSSEFIFVLSKNSLESNWVKFEGHMAVIRHLEDADFRLVVIRIDDSTVPLRFKPFLYIDGSRDRNRAIREVLGAIQRRRSGEAGIVFRRKFVNRSSEIGQIEAAVGDPAISLVCLFGMYGMGKRSTVDEAIKRIWQKASVQVIALTEAFTGVRLALELSAIAGLNGPEVGASEMEVRQATLLAAETIVSRGQTLVFDRFESLLDDTGKPHRDIASIISHLSEIKPCFKMPVFMLSKRMPHLPNEITHRLALVKVKGLSAQHTVTILENEVNRIERQEYPDRASLEKVAEQLHGYPLATRLAAPLLVKYSPEYLLENLIHVTEVRRDVAEAILSYSRLSDCQTDILKILSLCDTSLTVRDICDVTGRIADDVAIDVDRLADDNLVEPDGIAIRLHPLVLEFYWKQARSSPQFKQMISAIAAHATSVVRNENAGTERFIHWLAVAVRTLFLAGDPHAARSLRRDLFGELKTACLDLYERKDYSLCLQYCHEYLAAEPSDFEIVLRKARCLSRLNQPQDALVVLNELIEASGTTYRRVRVLFAFARTYLEARDLAEAKKFYVKALDLDPNYMPALQGLTEVLLKDNHNREAETFVNRAIRIAPMNSWALSTQAELLWRKGHVAEAISAMERAVVSQPDNPTFLFRLGRFYQQTGAFTRAYEKFKEASHNDSSYWDARLSFASLAINLGKLDEAGVEIDALRGRVGGEKRVVLFTIEADYLLARGNADEAEKLATSALDDRRDVVTLGMMAKIEVAKGRAAALDGMDFVGESCRSRARALIEEGLALEPYNAPLRSQLDGLNGIGR